MLFNSIHFVLFFPIVTLVYFLLPYKIRWLHLLLSSCYFYMVFKPVYILILFFIILIDYFAAIYIEKSSTPKRKHYLIISILANICILCFFKYFNFFNSNLDFLLHSLGQKSPLPYLDWLLPIGLSFHTFQAMSYTIEVYRGNQVAEKHLGIYALYVMFYPQLVAGPIERPQNIIPQLHQSFDFDYHRVTNGLKLMAWGMFKKVVIADRFAVFVNMVYDNPTQYQNVPLIVATLLFSCQIYCDFSGYSDIAIGSAQVMGIKLMTNFNTPYLSENITQFWQRWHISLSSWFRDYLYIPMGGNRKNVLITQINTLCVFLISGLWHGANWTFIIWGFLHAFLIISTSLIRKINLSLSFPKLVNIFFTFLLVSLAWVFFRAKTTTEALYIFTHFHTGLSTSSKTTTFLSFWQENATNLAAIGWTRIDWLLTPILIILLIISDIIQNKKGLITFFNSQHLIIRWSIYFTIVFFIIFLGKYEELKFIYFQF
jgi:alginate O-acetyltransferase complex protein AlgI